MRNILKFHWHYNVMIILAKFASNLEMYRKIARCGTLQTYKINE